MTIWKSISPFFAKGKGNRPMILALLLGCILLLFPTSKQERPTDATPSIQQETDSFDLSATQAEMESILSCIEGAGKLKLMLTLSSSSTLTVATDEQLSYDGTATQPENYQRQRETVLLSQGSGTEAPIITQKRYPKYQGALVVCEGADKPSVRLAITESVSALTGLKSNTISVVKWQSH